MNEEETNRGRRQKRAGKERERVQEMKLRKWKQSEKRDERK